MSQGAATCEWKRSILKPGKTSNHRWHSGQVSTGCGWVPGMEVRRRGHPPDGEFWAGRKCPSTDREPKSHLGTENWHREQERHEWIRREGKGGAWVQAVDSLPEFSGESQTGLHTLSRFQGAYPCIFPVSMPPPAGGGAASLLSWTK